MRARKLILKIILLVVITLILLGVKYPSSIYTSVYPAFRYMESYLTADGIKDYDKHRLGDFIIRSQIDYSDSIELVYDVAKRYSPSVFEFFNYERTSPVEIALFSTEQDLKELLGISQDLSALGAYSGGRLNLLRPQATDIDLDLSQDGNLIDNIFIHELVHLVLDDLAMGRYPLWFTEGSALYMEYLLVGYEWGVHLNLEEAYKIDDLTHRFSSLDEQMAYRQSFLLVKNLIEGFGRESYLDLLDELGGGAGFTPAIFSIYGLEKEGLQGLIHE
ncbi:MAG TPA: peptidase MA family metallohydrolase [Bacillota bacterium]|nr:peptidase MA family metallohydrolase [Bacillota bacterium]